MIKMIVYEISVREYQKVRDDSFEGVLAARKKYSETTAKNSAGSVAP